MWKLFFIFMLLACIPPLTPFCLAAAFIILLSILQDWLPLIIIGGIGLYVAYKLWEADSLKHD